VNRRHIDNGTAAARLEQRVGQLGAQKGRAQVRGNRQIPLCHRGFDDGLGHLERGIVHQRVQRVRERAGLRDDALQRGGVGNIGLDEEPIRRERLAKRGAVHANDGPAVLGKELHRGAANAARGAGDEHNPFGVRHC